MELLRPGRFFDAEPEAFLAVVPASAQPHVPSAMKHQTLNLETGFRVGIGNRRSQSAVMVIEPGETEGGPRNSHRGADQWLLVLDGEGAAIVNGKKLELESGMLLLIEAGEKHEIRNTGPDPLRTVSVYVPPAYASDGEELEAGKSGE